MVCDESAESAQNHKPERRKNRDDENRDDENRGGKAQQNAEVTARGGWIIYDNKKIKLRMQIASVAFFC